MKEKLKSVMVGSLPILPFNNMQEIINHLSPNGTVEPGFAIAINAEKVVASLADPKLRNVVQQGTLLFPDGIAVVKTMRKKGVASERIPGCELWVELMKKVAESGQSVYLLGASEETNKATADKLKSEFGLQNLVRRNGFFEDDQSIINEVARVKPDIVTVALGSPRQEFLISKLRHVHPDAFYMGVGGSYDVFVGKVKRAPKIFCDLHLEWFYRLISQPKRIFRQGSLLRYFYLHITGKL